MDVLDLLDEADKLLSSHKPGDPEKSLGYTEFHRVCDLLNDNRRALIDIAKAANKVMQEHLDDYAHGTVKDVQIDDLGWGQCAWLDLLKALKKLDGGGDDPKEN